MTTESHDFKEWIRTVLDPDIGVPIVDLGLVYECKFMEPKTVNVTMTLTSPACPAGDYLVSEIKKRLLEHEFVETASVDIVWDPKWDPHSMATEEIKDQLGLW